MSVELLADVKAQRKRLDALEKIDAKNELAKNVYPLLEKIVTAMRGLGEEVEAVVAEMDDQGSLIEPELSAEIIKTLDFASQLIMDAVRLLEIVPDEVLRKRFRDRAEEFQRMAGVATVGVLDATLSEDEEGDEEDLEDTKPDPVEGEK